ncbi:Protein YrdA [subsurface metagenome]
MTVYKFEERVPKIGKNTYISKSATIIGDVTIGNGCFIGPGARIKGDYGRIIIGDETSVQENCVIHARPDEVCKIGSRVNIGHASTLHGCTVEDNAIIGMGSIISDWACIGEWAVVGEGAVVKQNQNIPARKICVGVPAKIIGDVKEDYKKEYEYFKDTYVELAKRYSKNLKRLDIENK